MTNIPGCKTYNSKTTVWALNIFDYAILTVGFFIIYCFLANSPLIGQAKKILLFLIPVIFILMLAVRIWFFVKFKTAHFYVFTNPLSYFSLFTLFTLVLVLLNNYICYVSFGFSNFHDLALYNQAMFNFVHGRGFADPVWGGNSIIAGNLFGDHSEIGLVFISIFYLFWQSPLNLLFIQGLIMVLSAIPLVLLAKDKLNDNLLAVIIGFAYLTCLPIMSLAVWTEFRSIVLVIPLLFLSFYYYQKDRKWPFIILILLSALIKEEVPLILSTLGLYISIFNKNRAIRRPVGVFLFFAGLMIFLFVIYIFVPYFGKQPYPHFVRLIGGNSGLISIIKNPLLLLANPEYFSLNKFNYFSKILLSLGLFPLFSLLFLIPLSNWLQVIMTPDASVVSQQWHNIIIFSFIFISLIWGVCNLHRKLKLKYAYIKIILSLLVFFWGFQNYYNYIILPLKSRGVFDNAFSTERYTSLKNSINSIPPDASVYTTFRLLPYLSNRQHVYWYPKITDWHKVDYFIFDINDSFLEKNEKDKLQEGLATGYFIKQSQSGPFQLWNKK